MIQPPLRFLGQLNLLPAPDHKRLNGYQLDLRLENASMHVGHEAGEDRLAKIELVVEEVPNVAAIDSRKVNC